jgi:hypothetical protein
MKNTQSITEITGLSIYQMSDLLTHANKELSEKKVPNVKRGPKNVIARGLRISEELDQMLEALTLFGKSAGELEPFEKKNDLIRHLISKHYASVFGPVLGRTRRVHHGK